MPVSLPRQLFSDNRKAKAYTSNVTTAPPHNLPGRDPERMPDETESAESTTAPPYSLPGRDPERLPDETETAESTIAPPHNFSGRDLERLPNETKPESAESTTPAAPPQNLPGRDPERLPDETGSSLWGTLGHALENYSTHPSGLQDLPIYVNFDSILLDVC